MTSLRTKATTGADLVKGVKWGVWMALIFASFAVIGRIVGGSRMFEGGLTFPKTLFAECGSGIVGGLIVGVTYRQIRSIVSAALVGLLVGLVCGVAMEMADVAGTSWRNWDLGLVVVYGVLGLVVAAILWRRRATMSALQ